MTETDDYLARLDSALRDVPHGVAAEIRDGIAEELRALDADTAAARIAQLGDPTDIAREAMSGTSPAPAPAVVTTPATRPSVVTGRGFAIFAALVLGFGSFVLPFIGWLVGVVLVCLSTVWTRWEKAVAILAPAVAAVVVVLVLAAVSAIGGGSDQTESAGTNPLVPGVHGLLGAGTPLSLLVAGSLCGLWLLWRLRGRSIR